MSGKSFISKNIVAIVVVPMIIGAHYGWYKLQEVDSLVSAEDRKKLAIGKLFKSKEASVE